MDLPSRLDHHLASRPKIAESCFVAAGAVVLGDVTLGDECSVWYQTVLRGDINSITFGPRSNIQDGAVIHLADEFGVSAGELVTVGHKAILHACTVGNEVL